MATNHKERLSTHIKALEKSYDNIMLLLQQDIDKDEKTSEVKLKDSQIEIYAKGILKCSETSDYLLNQIKIKQEELDKLNSPEKPKDGDSDVKEVPQSTSSSNLGQRLK